MGNKNAARSVLTISVLVVISKIMGFLREMSMARAFGTGPEMDAYSMSLTILAVMMFLISAYLGTTFMPKFLKIEKERGADEAGRFSSNVLCITLSVAVLISIIGVAFAPHIVRLIVPGFESGGERFNLTVQMTRMMVWTMVFNCVVVIFTSLLNAREAYVLPQITGFPLSIITIVYCLTVSSRWGAMGLAFLHPFIFLIQILMLYPGIRRQKIHLRPMYNPRDSDFKETLALMLPVMIINVMDSVNILVDKAIASSLPVGSVGALNFAHKLSSLFVSIIAVSIGTVLFTKVSQRATQNDMKGIKDHLSSSFELLSFIILPITVICITQSTEIIKLAYERGSFDANSTAMTSTAFLYYTIGLFGLSAALLFTRTFYALQNTKSPMFSNIAAVCIDTMASIILSRVMGIGGLALGTALGSTMLCAMQLIMMRRRLGKGCGLSVRIIAKLVPCLAICAFVSFGCSYLLRDAAVILRFGVVVLAGSSAYAASALILRLRPMFTLLDMAKGIIKRS